MQFGEPTVGEPVTRPCRQIALRRRELSALITEELRRLDVDDIFAASMSTLVDRCERRDAEKARR